MPLRERFPPTHISRDRSAIRGGISNFDISESSFSRWDTPIWRCGVFDAMTHHTSSYCHRIRLVCTTSSLLRGKTVFNYIIPPELPNLPCRSLTEVFRSSGFRSVPKYCTVRHLVDPSRMAMRWSRSWRSRLLETYSREILHVCFGKTTCGYWSSTQTMRPLIASDTSPTPSGRSFDFTFFIATSVPPHGQFWSSSYFLITIKARLRLLGARFIPTKVAPAARWRWECNIG